MPAAIVDWWRRGMAGAGFALIGVGMLVQNTGMFGSVMEPVSVILVGCILGLALNYRASRTALWWSSSGMGSGLFTLAGQMPILWASSDSASLDLLWAGLLGLQLQLILRNSDEYRANLVPSQDSNWWRTL